MLIPGKLLQGSLSSLLTIFFKDYTRELLA